MAAARIDLVLLDMQMPRAGGDVVLRHMRTDDRLAQLPVLVLTGSPDRVPTDIFSLTKPVALETLISVVNGMVGPALPREPTPPRSRRGGGGDGDNGEVA